MFASLFHDMAIHTPPPLPVILEKLNLNSERDVQKNVRVYGCTRLAVQEEQFDDYHSMCVLLVFFNRIR